MITTRKKDDVRRQVEAWKKEGETVGLVPTMGAIHQGHASLVRAAKEQCDRVVTSIFVNPVQFGEGEDLSAYPRTLDKDCAILKPMGCDMVFSPAVEEMYGDGFATYVEVQSDMTKQLCGRSRPGHFRGVCTVVSKLFNIASPDKAFFGEKDAQQLAVVKRMAEDMDFDVEIVGCPIVREKDGLAMSSRNSYLSSEERAAAPVLHRTLEEIRLMISDEGVRDAGVLRNRMEELIGEESLAKIDYAEIVDGRTLMSVDTVKDGDLAALAVYIGRTRLIDNFTVR